ncbi:MAG: formate dehydrogenase subunit gamma [Solirubrobacteraceae bacterium]|nr:formate dehydrogenase subunit gamma [Solirubrobacteraceae bacterium]
MAVDPRLSIVAEPRVVRFGSTERRLHTAHAAAFGVLLVTGFALYLPFLAQIVSDRPLMKSIHLVAAVGWLTALVLVVVLGDRAALRRTRREIERFDADDLLFLRRRPAAAGRFNGGQKAHAIVQAGLAVLFVVSGALLWLGERNTQLRLPGTIALHDAATLLVAVLVAGHIVMAIGRPQSLEGIWRGTVPASYAAEHHPRWRPGAAAARSRAGAARLALALVVAAAGLAAAVALVRDVAG